MSEPLPNCPYHGKPYVRGCPGCESRKPPPRADAPFVVGITEVKPAFRRAVDGWGPGKLSEDDE